MATVDVAGRPIAGGACIGTLDEDAEPSRGTPASIDNPIAVVVLC